MFAYEPLDGYRDKRDAIELPWELWEKEASTRGGDIISLFADASQDRPDSNP